MDEMITAFRDEHFFLSNFYPVKIHHGDLDYPSVENAFQAFKTLDDSQRRQIAEMTPRDARRFGRRLTLRPGWDDMRLDVMRFLVEQKFKYTDLALMLMGTYPQPLVEVNGWGDTFWGVSGGKGENWLGRILMEVRSGLVVVDEP